MEKNELSNLEEKSPWRVYQCKEWEDLKYLSGKKPVVISLEKEGELKARILAFEQDIKTPLGSKKVLFAEGLPLFSEEVYFREIISKFKKEAKKYFYGTISPTVLSKFGKVFEEEGYFKIKNYTILIDLRKSEEDLFQSLEKKSSRWGVKFAEKNDLSFQEVKKEDLKSFYDMYLNTTSEGNFPSESYEFLKGLYNSSIGRIFVVKKGKDLLAGGAILLDKDYAVLNLTSSSEAGHKYQAMPFLYWNLIKYAKSLGKEYFDLGGYDKEAKEGEKTLAINKFKERFGGEIVEQPVYSTNKKYTFLRKAMKKIKFIKKLYKKQ